MKDSRAKVGFTFRDRMKKMGSLIPFYLPAMAVALVFCYIPMLGLIMAFKAEPNMYAYEPIQAILSAPFNQFENFKVIFSRPEFSQALLNTLVISGLKIVIVFPLPIILAIMLTEVRGKRMTRALEIVMYLPHFLSWVTVDMIFLTLMNADIGFINGFLATLGFKKVSFITDPNVFPWTIVFLSAWKDIGWSTITYIAAITVIDPALYEAAELEGASKLQRIRHITLPCISSTIAVLFIMRIGYVMDAGFEQIYLLYTPNVQKTGEILGIYSYRLFTDQSTGTQFRLSASIGLFNSCIGLILILVGNFVSKKLFHRGVW